MRISYSFKSKQGQEQFADFKVDVLDKREKRVTWYHKQLYEQCDEEEVPFTQPIIQCCLGDSLEIPVPLDTSLIQFFPVVITRMN
jgi:hypothetical protein